MGHRTDRKWTTEELNDAVRKFPERRTNMSIPPEIAVRNFAEGLRCSLGQLAGNLTAKGNAADGAGADGREYHWRAEGVREAIILVMAQLEERKR